MEYFFAFLILMSLIVGFVGGLSMLFTGWLIVPEKTYLTTTWLGGKFHKIYEPGFHLKMPWPFEGVDKRVSTNIQLMELQTTSLTRDNARLAMKVAVQYLPLRGKFYEAAYALDDAQKQLQSYLEAQLRSEINGKTVSEIYSSRGEFTDRVIADLSPFFEKYGFHVENILIDQPTVSSEMLEAFERKLVAESKREAAEAEGEAEKVVKVKRAEAEGEALKTKTRAWKEVRNMMAEGNAESLNSFVGHINDGSIKAADALTFFSNLDMRDTMREASQHGAKIVFIAKEADSNIGQVTAAIQTQSDDPSVAKPRG